MVPMDVPLIRRLLPTATVALGGLLWLAGLLLLAQSAQNSTQFGRLHPWILMFNVAGLVVLVALLAVKLGQLVRDWRGNVIGSRLKARMVWIFGVLATLPILIVYFFAVQFLSRGIDSWFNVEIRQSLDDALVLSRAALEVRMREHLADTELIADELLDVTGSASGPLESLRRDVGALELTLATGQGRVLGVSKGQSAEIVPESVPDEVLLQVRQGNPFVALEPQSSGGYLVRAAVAIRPAVPGQSMRVLQAMYPVSERLSGLADTVQAAYQQYGEKDYLRRPLKTSFILTLTIVLLLSLLAAWYGAIFTAQRLVQPIQDLVAGTRAVAQGDLDTRLPLTSHDEMGFLVHSFNDMTKRLRRARADQLVAQQVAEQERANLAVVLGNLSTGVIVLEPDLRIRSANRAAGSILGEDTSGWIGQRLDEVGAEPGLGRQLLTACQERLAAGQSAWREQFAFQPESGRRVLMCACSRLPGEGEQSSGQRARLRRHHGDAAGAARGGLGRGREAARARDQESADADPALGRADAPEADAGARGKGCAGARPRHRDDRAAGRGDEGDGQRLQRVRPRAAHRSRDAGPERAGRRGGRTLSRARRESAAADRARSRSADGRRARRSRPDPPVAAQSAEERGRGARGAAAWRDPGRRPAVHGAARTTSSSCGSRTTGRASSATCSAGYSTPT